MATQYLQITSPRNYTPFQESERQPVSQKQQLLIILMKKHSKLRETSIQWLTRACAKYKYKKDTLFLTIKIMDILINENFFAIFQDYQLVLASLVLLSTKYNQVYPVTIDQVNLITQKYYPREILWEVQGDVLNCLNFQMPDCTIFSHLYNQLEPTFGKAKNTDSDKENEGDHANVHVNQLQKALKPDQHTIVSKSLKALKEPECFKYGEEFLFHALSSYLQNKKSKGVSVNVVKTNYIKTVLKKLFQREKNADHNENGKINFNKGIIPIKQTKLNPQLKIVRKQKIFLF